MKKKSHLYIDVRTHKYNLFNTRRDISKCPFILFNIKDSKSIILVLLMVIKGRKDFAIANETP